MTGLAELLLPLLALSALLASSALLAEFLLALWSMTPDLLMATLGFPTLLGLLSVLTVSTSSILRAFPVRTRIHPDPTDRVVAPDRTL